MKQIEIKRDALVLIPYVVVLIALFTLVGVGRISWAECLGGLALLNVPAIFGLAKKSTSNGDAAALLVCIIAFGATACASGMSDREKAAAAESTHAAEHLRCVDEATTIEESHACRAKVREKWAAKDAGGDR